MVEGFLAQVAEWAAARTDIRALGLVGSHARGTARQESDVDLLLLTTTPEKYTANADWARRFGRIASHEVERWGRVSSVRVWYESGLEVEIPRLPSVA